MEQSHFSAPWGTSLKIMTAFSVFVLTGIPVVSYFLRVTSDLLTIIALQVAPLCTIVIAGFFMIRAYQLTMNTLAIERLGWHSKIELTGLLSAKADRDAMSKSIRTFGNGGLFCFAGYFRNKKLGSYRAFATDPKRSVVLRFDKRTIVVTPDNPEKFVEYIKQLRNLPENKDGPSE
jgi:hypothetical protein